MSRWFDAILTSLKRIGTGRILVGVVVGILVGGPVLGVLAAEGVPGLDDAVRPSSQDDDDLEDELTPTPGGPGDDPDQLATASPTSVAGPTETLGPAETLEPTATLGPTATESPDTTVSPDVPVDQASPDQPSPGPTEQTGQASPDDGSADHSSA